MKSFLSKKRLWAVLTSSALSLSRSLRRRLRWNAWRSQFSRAIWLPRIHYRIALLLAVILAVLLWWSVVLFTCLPTATLPFGGHMS